MIEFSPKINAGWHQKLQSVPRWTKYSQTHEDAIAAELFKLLPSQGKYLVDLGAGDGYSNSNTRLLLENGWHGLLIDGDPRGNQQVMKHFLTKDNILNILNSYAVPPEFDFLSIDLDGNDYYFIQEVTKEYKPTIICAEINGCIPVNVAATIMYNPTHTWNNDDYYGFSYAAAFKLAEEIGYTVIWENDALNVWLMRSDWVGTEKIELPAFKRNPYHAHNPNGIWKLL